jgi:thymidylate synthase
MHIIHARNVNEAYVVGLRDLLARGKEEDSRAGKVITYPSPVCTTYVRPWERVLFNKIRDANPFFHLMEALWMLNGRNDVKWISEFNSQFYKFSDNGKNFHGAYGTRWRRWFGQNETDQIIKIIRLLKKDPNTRRAVLTMWDPVADLGKEGKDFPCNLTILFRARAGRLDMTVCNRSNDIIWGAYGANAVHMSMLQEYMASMTGFRMGYYHQVSNDFHAYVDILDKLGSPDPAPEDPYDYGNVTTMPMVENPKLWDEDLSCFIHEIKIKHYSNPFFGAVAEPMRQAWRAWKHKNYQEAHNQIDFIMASDWRAACKEWLVRRQNNAANKTGRKRSQVAHDSPSS